MRNELLEQEAIQEELAGFFLDHVINKSGEYHVEVDFNCYGTVIERSYILYMYVASSVGYMIRKLVVRPISRRRRGRSITSLGMHDELLYSMVLSITYVYIVRSVDQART